MTIFVKIFVKNSIRSIGNGILICSFVKKFEDNCVSATILDNWRLFG